MANDVVVRDSLTLEGARVVVPTTTIVPDRGLTIQPQRVGNPTTTIPAVPVGLNCDMSRVWINLTLVVLSAGASFTSAPIDCLNYASRGIFIRSDQPVSVEIQESHDATTFATTAVYYLGDGPGRTFHGIISCLINTRWWRIIVTNLGTAAQTTFRLDWISQALPVPFFISPPFSIIERTTTTLAGGGIYSGRTLRTLNMKALKILATASHDGTIRIEESEDGTTWRITRTWALTAGTAITIRYTDFATRFIRASFLNGATAQTSFDFTISVENSP